MSAPECMAPEFSVERITEEIKDIVDGKVMGARLSKLIIRNENNEALKTAE